MNKQQKFVNIMQKGVTPIFETTNDSCYPTVYYSADVAVAIDHIVQSQEKEVAWMGLVDKISETEYLIYKIYIPEQEVTASTAEIEDSGISKLVMQIMDEGEDPGKLRYHGHSHVRMGVSPSSTDQDHMSDYLEHADWFIREIRNKKGDQKLDLFDKEHGVAYQCIDSEIWELTRDASFFEELDMRLKEAVTSRTFKPFKGNVIPAYYNARKNDAEDAELWTPSKVAERISALPNKTKEEQELEDLMSDPFGVADSWSWYKENDY